ncbi:MAG: ATP-dependent helicase [Dehalococcoidia bacterium]
MDVSSLNESQLAAVRWQSGPLLVVAGPGSGKTRVLTHRIARLIEESPEKRFHVLGITFTNKAALEMRTRIDSLLAQGRERAHLTTFHSFAASLLRQHGSHVGLRPDFAILSEPADREAVLSDALMGRANASDSDIDLQPAQLMPTIDRMLDECVSPEAAERWLGANDRTELLADIYRRYWTLLIEKNQMDFGTLLALAIQLFEKRPAIARQVRQVYEYVCVDEYQDTNGVQDRLLRTIVSHDNPNLFVVADDDQLIYEWNGANPTRIKSLVQQYKMQTIQLPENFRCPPDVIRLANNLIRHNAGRLPDKLPITPHKLNDGSRAVSVRRFSSFEEECNWLATEIARLPAEDRSQAAVLARRKRLLDVAVEALTAAGVNAYIAVRRNEFQSAPYRFLHAALRLANSRQDRAQLRKLSRAFFEIEGINADLDAVEAEAALAESDLLRSWVEHVASRSALSSASRAFMYEMQKSIVDRLEHSTFIGQAHTWFEVVRLEAEAQASGAFAEFDDECKIWQSLTSEIGAHYGIGELTLHGLLQELDLRAKEVPPGPNAVRCLTIHGSKGLEFRHVFLVGLVEEELPSFAATKLGGESNGMREERRNCFVAITRAERSLSLSFADTYFGWDKEPSRFLEEMGIRIQAS